MPHLHVPVNCGTVYQRVVEPRTKSIAIITPAEATEPDPMAEPLVDDDPNAFMVGRQAASVLDKMMSSDKAAAKPPTLLVPPKGVVTRPSTETYPVNPPWLSNALVFIRKQVSRKTSAADVFRHLGLSHAIVEKAFRNVLHSSVQREIMKCRIEEAEHLLKTTQLSVVRIAGLAGFASAQYFCRCFSAATGLSPQVYREKSCSKN